MNRALALAIVPLLAACGGSRPGERELVRPTTQQEAETLARVQWQTLFDRGEQLANAGDLVRAEQYLAAAIRRGAPSERVLPELMRVCVAAQRYRAAVEYASPYLDVHQDAWRLRYLVATIEMGLGEAARARAQLELVLQYNPQHAEAEFALGKILRDDLGDPSGADVHFRRYLQLEPDGTHAEEARAGLLQQVHP